MLESYIEYITKNRRYSHNTVISYRNDVECFLEFSVQSGSIKSLNDLTFNAKSVRNWIVSMSSQGISGRSLKRKISSVKSYFKFLILNNKISENPASKIIYPKQTSKLPEFIDQDKLDDLQLFENNKPDNSFEMAFLVLEILYGSGIRRSELINLKISDFDKIKSTIKVLGKGNKERIIPIPETLNKMICDYLLNREIESPYIITCADGKKAYPKLVYRIVNKYLSLVTTQKKRSPHVLRHSYATNMLNNGADINSIKELLGHANLSATQIYTHTSFEKINSIYKQAHPRASKKMI